MGVYYLEPSGSGTTHVHRLRVGSNGEFLTMAGGFFEERYQISSMNDLYTTDPRIFGTSREFLSFIQAFGHHTGRHMLELPNDWRGSLLEHFGDAGELERKRILEAVRIAIRRGGLYSAPGQWQATINEGWSEMAVRFFSRHPKRLKGYICEEETTAKPRMPPEMPVMAYESLALKPTEAEEIRATPREYCRVCKPLLRSSEELIFVDPYLNILDQRVMAVFQEFLTEILAAKRRVKLVLWVRASAVAERNAFKSWLREILSDADARQISFEDRCRRCPCKG